MTNQDQLELDKFNCAADSWWQSESLVHPLHAMNPVRLEWIQSHTTLSQKKILDVGCGGGILSEALARAGGKVTGIDLASEALQAAKNHAIQSRLTIDYFCESAEAFAKTHEGQYDIVTCMELLEHVPNPASVVNACAQLLKPDGCVFFSTINRNIKSWAMAIVGAEYIMQLLPRGTHTFNRFITPAELSSFARTSGLHVSDITGMNCDINAENFYLTSDVSINYMLFCTKND